MAKQKRTNFNKLSEDFAPAALATVSGNLARLRRLIQGGAEISDKLSRVTTGLRNVAAPPDQPFIFTTRLADNRKLLEETFRNCDDVKFRDITFSGGAGLIVYLSGLTDSNLIELQVIKPLLADKTAKLNTVSAVADVLTAASVEVKSDVAFAMQAVMTGNPMLLIDGHAQIIIIGATKHVKRGIEEAKTETAARGPHEAFTETLSDNIALIRRRARDSNIKIKIFQVGNRSKTALAIIYASSIVKPGLVPEVERRIAGINLDQVLFSAQIEEFIIDHPWSPFPQTQVTERPDTMLISVYEGRVGIIVDNTPHALIVPCTFTALLQSVEDFTVQPIIASLIRISRYVAAFLGVFLPALYIAFVSYNPGMMPTSLAVSVAELRARTPYPAFMEVLIMEAILELFQEAVLRIPQKIAPAASIVGGFVIGTTIVQAGLVNALLVVATAGTAIASYTMPSFNLGLALRWLRLPTIFLAAMLGIYGVLLAYIAILIHACSVRSFGESFLGGLFDLTLAEDMRDKLVRLPMTLRGLRPKQFGAQDRTRTEDDDGGS